MNSANDENIVTIKLTLDNHNNNTVKVVKIDPITRLKLIKNKQDLKQQVIKKEEEEQESGIEKKEELLNKYKKIADQIDFLVKNNKSNTVNKITKNKKKTKTIKINKDDLIYDVSLFPNKDAKPKSSIINNVIIKDNNIVIDNINDENLKINISNIINREIEKSTQNSNLNSSIAASISTSSVNKIGSTFATPSSKVINFNTNNNSNLNGSVNKINNNNKKVSQDEEDHDDEGGRKKKRARIEESISNGKKVAFGISSISENEPKKTKEKPSTSLPNFAFGGTNPTATTNNSLPAFNLNNTQKEDTTTTTSSSTNINKQPTLSFANKATAEKPASESFNFGKKESEKKPVPSTTPSFNFGGSNPIETKPSQPVFSFGKSDNTPMTDNKVTSNVVGANTPPTFSFDSSSSEKKEEANTNNDNKKEPVNKSGFGLDLGVKKEDANKIPSFSFGSTNGTEKKKETKPSFNFGTAKKEESKPTFNFGTEKKENDTKPSFGFGTEKKENDTKPSFGFGTEKKENDTITKPNFGGVGNSVFEKTDNVPSRDKPTPAFSFGSASSTNNPPSRFNPGNTAPATTGVTSTTTTKPASRFDPTPVGDKLVSRFEAANNKPIMGLGSAANSDNKVPASTGFNVGGDKPASKPPVSTTFNFGSSASNGAVDAVSGAAPKSTFGLSSVSSSLTPSNSMKPSFNFGSTNNSNTDAKLTFGNTGPALGQAPNTNTKFNFGQAAPTNAPNAGILNSGFNFGSTNNNNTPGTNGSSFGTSQNNFASKPPINNISQPNPMLHKPVTGFNFGGSNNNTNSTGQLNFNLSDKFKSPTPPVPQMGAALSQQTSFNPSANLNFSFSNNNSASAVSPIGSSVSPQIQNPQNMMFGGFNQQQQQQQQPQQGGMNFGGSAPIGRRIAKLRRR
ncbi:hypothetical protein HANVADRAFT_52719 [Hanseniaspora valbyensis NRRL Y-1626]|uniref:Uncharacterized protein n=1 Tax=Hanseniaspora valbyensis NRRL Y-1626 TaxID=766949 RepID=A0A1B7TE39_9ASCO|nr:hypothetical protein HANVADRAFT_52719 [Hanseniaspora valbyensis NRRL Y-1626]